MAYQPHYIENRGQIKNKLLDQILILIVKFITLPPSSASIHKKSKFKSWDEVWNLAHDQRGENYASPPLESPIVLSPQQAAGYFQNKINVNPYLNSFKISLDCTS